MGDRPKIDLMKRAKSKPNLTQSQVRSVMPNLSTPQVPQSMKRAWKKANDLARPLAEAGTRLVEKGRKLIRGK